MDEVRGALALGMGATGSALAATFFRCAWGPVAATPDGERES